MSNTDLNRGSRSGTIERDGREGEAKLVTRTETRRSTKTSELWLAIASFAAIVIAGYFSDALSVDRAWLFATVVMAAYIVSRGLAKAGSSDPTVQNVDLRR
jgi:hypothetical protein